MISIHAPHTGRDTAPIVILYQHREFQSTRPIRGATAERFGYTARICNFNPRAPYGARRTWRIPLPSGCRHFNPRAPYGARLFRRQRRGAGGDRISIHAPHTGRDWASISSIFCLGGFQSTRPIRGATQARDLADDAGAISIHAPHTGRDPRSRSSATSLSNFNPRAPYGARRLLLLAARAQDPISIHAPHTGRDRRSYGNNRYIYSFQSTRPIRGAT